MEPTLTRPLAPVPPDVAVDEPPARDNGMLRPPPAGVIKSEKFGQSESITRRLRHILELYPEGNPILSELIQNADDARATTVKVCLKFTCYFYF